MPNPTNEQEAPETADDLYVKEGAETPEIPETESTPAPQEAAPELPETEEAADPEETQPAEVSEAAKPAEPLSDERIAEITARVLKAQQPKQEEPQLSAEQIEKLINPVKVTKEDVAELTGQDPATVTDKQVAFLQRFANATAKNATSLSALVLEQRSRALESKYEPVRSYYEQQQARAQVDAYHAQYPHLKQYEKISQSVARTVSPTKVDGSFKTPQEIFKEVSDGVVATLKASGINITASQARTSASASSAVPTMAQRQQPGRSAAGQSKGKPNDPDNDIYE